MRPERALLVWPLVLVLLLAGCAGRLSKDGPPRGGSVVPRSLPDNPVPRPEPRSPYGNGPIYKALGRSYEVMQTSYGYQERGVASWYGKKFHGRETANREHYDMYAMTAAHKSLPLPTYVRVKNLRNNKSVIVRVNDRGPFVDNRLIDLSYSAAKRLDIIRDGTGLVEVTAISFDEPPPRQMVAQALVEAPAATPVTNRPTKQASGPAERPAVPKPKQSTVYVQVGAFGDAENARRRFAVLRSGGVGNAFVLEDSSQSPTLYRIRIGPIADVDQYDRLVARLQNLGISDTHLVTE